MGLQRSPLEPPAHSVACSLAEPGRHTRSGGAGNRQPGTRRSVSCEPLGYLSVSMARACGPSRCAAGVQWGIIEHRHATVIGCNDAVMRIFLYVDNSNTWIEGMRYAAVRHGLTPDLRTAQKDGITDPSWRYDFGHLYALAAPEGTPVGQALLFGSRPPANDSLWQLARDNGFTVEVLDRNASNKEKGVDTGLGTRIVEDSFIWMKTAHGDRMVLAAGDLDYLAPVKSLAKRGFRTTLLGWTHSTSRELIEACDSFVALEDHFQFLTR